MDAAQVDYADARTTLRPARVAVVFDGGDDWHYWARLALYAAPLVWGGTGFILVSHRGGEVAPILLQAACAYDPDYVVLLRVTMNQFEAARPGELPLLINGQPVSGADREKLLEQVGGRFLDDPAGERARQAVAEVCSPYRERVTAGEAWFEEATALNAAGANGYLTSVYDLEGALGGSRLAAPADWGGPWG